MDLYFAVYKLVKFSLNPGKVHFEGLVQFFIYIRYKKNLGLKNYVKIQYAPLSELLRQAIIKTDNQFMVLFDSIWKDWPDTSKITGEYIVFYQGVPIDHCTHVPGLVSQYSTGIEYNAACTAGMSLEYFRMLNNEFLNKDPDEVSWQSPLIILDIYAWLRMVRIPNTPNIFQE